MLEHFGVETSNDFLACIVVHGYFQVRPNRTNGPLCTVKLYELRMADLALPFPPCNDLPAIQAAVRHGVGRTGKIRVSPFWRRGTSRRLPLMSLVVATPLVFDPTASTPPALTQDLSRLAERPARASSSDARLA